MAGTRNSGQRVLVEVEIGAPVASVWQAIRDPAIMQDWFGWDAESLKEEIEFIFITHAGASEANHTLQFGEWEGSADRFELEERGRGTLLRVVRSGPPGEGGADSYDEVTEGWISFVQQLKLLLERHAGEHRRTIYLSGKSRDAGLSPRGALGLESGATSVGAPVIVSGPDGEQVTGSLWHHLRHQTGVLVPAWGDGLLVVTDRPASEPSPNGGGYAILTTFGLSDKAFAALRSAWTNWWAARFPSGPS